MSAISLPVGEHCIVFGETGSGKTQLCLALVETHPVLPVVLFNSKEDDGINRFFKAKRKLDKKRAVKVATAEEAIYAMRSPIVEYINLVPDVLTAQDPDALDEILVQCFFSKLPHLMVVDELGMFHKGYNAGKGLLAYMQRGRSRKQTLLGCSQRPCGIARSLISESQQYFSFSLGDRRDIKHLWDAGVPYPETTIDRYHFWRYKKRDRESVLYSPIPITHDPGYAPGFSTTKWI